MVQVQDWTFGSRPRHRVSASICSRTAGKETVLHRVRVLSRGNKEIYNCHPSTPELGPRHCYCVCAAYPARETILTPLATLPSWERCGIDAVLWGPHAHCIRTPRMGWLHVSSRKLKTPSPLPKLQVPQRVSGSGFKFQRKAPKTCVNSTPILNPQALSQASIPGLLPASGLRPGVQFKAKWVLKRAQHQGPGRVP